MLDLSQFTGHTRSPWKDFKGWSVVGGDNSVVCKVLPWEVCGTRPEDTANLHLIAAAPDLLNEVKTLRTLIIEIEPDEEFRPCGIDKVYTAYQAYTIREWNRLQKIFAEIRDLEEKGNE